MQQLQNAELTLANVPEADADMERIGHFASTFDGYAHWGSFEKCAEIANEERHESLTNVRSCLFFECRRWRHYGDDPDAEAQEQWRNMVREVRRFVEAGKFE
jgi:hypothetical protein